MKLSRTTLHLTNIISFYRLGISLSLPLLVPRPLSIINSAESDEPVAELESVDVSPPQAVNTLAINSAVSTCNKFFILNLCILYGLAISLILFNLPEIIQAGLSNWITIELLLR